MNSRSKKGRLMVYWFSKIKVIKVKFDKLLIEEVE